MIAMWKNQNLKILSNVIVICRSQQQQQKKPTQKEDSHLKIMKISELHY